MSKLRRLVFAGAVVTLTVGAPDRARGQISTDNRSLFLAAVGGAAPELFSGIFAFTRNSHSASWGRATDRGAIYVPGMAYSAGPGGLLDDRASKSRALFRAINTYVVTFDPATFAIEHPTSTLASLLSGNDDARNVFLIFAQPGHPSTDAQVGAGNANVPGFVDLPAQAAPVGMTGDITLSDPAAPLAEVTAAPEPATLALVGTGLLGVAGWTRRRKPKLAT